MRKLRDLELNDGYVAHLDWSHLAFVRRDEEPACTAPGLVGKGAGQEGHGDNEGG